MYGVHPRSLFSSRVVPENTWIIQSAHAANPRPFALAGCLPSRSFPGTGLIWCVATQDIHEHKIEFIRHSKRFIADAAKGYDMVHNWVDARNELHIQWLRWTGFTIIAERHNFGASGKGTFYSFAKILSEGQV